MQQQSPQKLCLAKLSNCEVNEVERSAAQAAEGGNGSPGAVPPLPLPGKGSGSPGARPSGHRELLWQPQKHGPEQRGLLEPDEQEKQEKQADIAGPGRKRQQGRQQQP